METVRRSPRVVPLRRVVRAVLARPVLAVCAIFFGACGARTGLSHPEVDDAQPATSAPRSDSAIDVDIPVYDGPGDMLVPLDAPPLSPDCKDHDFCFDEPFQSPPTPGTAILAIGANIQRADVAFDVDTTGSMGSSLGGLETSLAGTLFPDLAKAIPSLALGVADFKDCGDTLAVKVLQLMTTDVAKAAFAVGTMSASGGGDEPESQVGAMLHTLTGDAIGECSGMPSTHVPAVGTWGGVDFRPGAVPIIALITDAHWHDPDGTATIVQLKGAFAATHARFVSLFDSHYLSTYPDLELQAIDLSDFTKSNVPPEAFGGACGAGKCCTGLGGAARAPDGPGGSCRLNFRVENGKGFSASIAKAIQAISIGTVFDVFALARNDPANADGVDATRFIKALRAMDEGDAIQGCLPHVATDTDGDGVKDTFVKVVSGTRVCFEVIARSNDFVPPKATPQYFRAFVDVLGMPGSVLLDRRDALFTVPAAASTGG